MGKKITFLRKDPNGMTQKFQVMLILIAGFLLNMVYSLWVAPLGNNETFVLETKYSGQGPQTYFFGDAPDYISLAINLKNGKGVAYPFEDPRPTAIRMPGFPLFLSWIFFFFGTRISIALLFQCLLLAGIFGIGYLLAKMFFSTKVARISLAVMLLWPNLKFYGCAYLGSETLAAFLFLIFIFCIIKGERAGSSWKWLAIGTVFFGGTIYTRPEFLIFTPFVCIWIVRHYHTRWRAAFTVLAMLILMLAPWTIRNFLIFDRFIPTTTGTGIVLAGSYNPKTIRDNPGGWDHIKIEIFQADGKTKDELKSDEFLKKYALGYIKQLNASQVTRLMFWKFLRTWLPAQRLIREQTGMINLKKKLTDPASILSSPQFFINILFTLFCLPVYFLFWVQLFRSYRDFRRRELLIYIFMFINLLVLLSFGSLRYRFMFEPIIVIFGCSLLFDRVRKKSC